MNPNLPTSSPPNPVAPPPRRSQGDLVDRYYRFHRIFAENGSPVNQRHLLSVLCELEDRIVYLEKKIVTLEKTDE